MSTSRGEIMITNPGSQVKYVAASSAFCTEIAPHFSQHIPPKVLSQTIRAAFTPAFSQLAIVSSSQFEHCHLAYVRLAQHEHAHAALAYAAAYGERKLAVQELPVVPELAAVVAAGRGKLPVRARRDPHGCPCSRARASSRAQLSPDEYIAIQRPVVVVRRAAVVGLSRI